ncbi:SDR family NAD(P)-dependent oxidoreductase [Streptomyces sp. NPDC005890]|uniref:SDR family NAD(P)-dependent oxidoreductase n=1 Tax=Streptomyces sp. NPDC005890 TaxID=3154568 RepID=UPI0033C5A086
MDLSTSTALVTGANRGLGRALAAELLSRGATAYAGARNPDQVDLPGVTPIALDITDPASVAAAAIATGDVTVLISNAGSSTGTLIARHNLAYWRGLAGERRLAVEEFTAAAEDAQLALGADHPTTLTYRVNLSFWRGLAGEPAMALAELAELQPRVDSVLGADHPRALRTRQQRAELMERSGDRGGAATLLTRCWPT